MNFFTTVYTLLLAYIVAALVFWGISLYKQSEHIYQQELMHLRSQVDSSIQPRLFNDVKHKFDDKRARRIKQYSGEGSTFLLIIFIGAAVVYSSYRRSTKLSRQQNNFMLSVTHELKSPIAAMKLNLQTLEKHKLDEEKRHLLIDKCINESNRLNDLCNNILLASQMEGKQYKPVFEKLNAAELLKNSASAYQHRYPERIIAELASGDFSIYGDQLMLQMAISNLMENALKYSSGTVTLQTSATKNNFHFSVADSGKGIPDSEKQKVFRKFYRIGNEATRTSKGTGLGLYITEKIIREHGGKIIVKDNQPKGVVFEVELPLV